jgi:hypothetical protein
VGTVGYVRRRLRPIVDTLQPTDQTVSFREQVATVARRISAPVVVVGLISGAGMVVISIMVVMNTVQAQRHVGALFAFQLFSVGFAVVLTAYFIWLIVLRMRMNGDAA